MGRSVALENFLPVGSSPMIRMFLKPLPRVKFMSSSESDKTIPLLIWHSLISISHSYPLQNARSFISSFIAIHAPQHVLRTSETTIED